MGRIKDENNSQSLVNRIAIVIIVDSLDLYAIVNISGCDLVLLTLSKNTQDTLLRINCSLTRKFI